MEQDQILSLVKKAVESRAYVYAPYSHFLVGAALLGKSGRIYTGCNIENGAYSPTNCAERTAFFKAVSEGEREFKGIAIAGGREDASVLELCPPCGVCRQVMREFCSDDFLIYLGKKDGNGTITWESCTLGDLLPRSFGKDNL